MNTQTTAVLETIDWQQRAEQAEARTRRIASLAYARGFAQSGEGYNAEIEPSFERQPDWQARMVVEVLDLLSVADAPEPTAALPWLQACEAGCQSASGAVACRQCPFPVTVTVQPNHIPCGECGACYANEPCSKLYAQHAGGTTQVAQKGGEPV